METTALSAIESYDYEKWNSAAFDRPMAQDSYVPSMMQMRPSQSLVTANDSHKWGQGTNATYSGSTASNAGFMAGQDQFLESDQALFNQPFFSDAGWGSTTPAVMQPQNDSPSNIWASPNQTSDDADALLVNWNQQCRLTDSPQQQDGSIAHDLSQSRSSSTESSHHPYHYGASPTSHDMAQHGYSSGVRHAKASSQDSSYPQGFAYYNPPTPTSVPGLYGASSGSTNTNSTTTLSWQPPPFTPAALSTNLSTPVFSRSRSAPVDFEAHTPTGPYTRQRSYGVLDSAVPNQDLDTSFNSSQRTNMLLEPSSLHGYRDGYSASPRQQSRRGSRGSNRGGAKPRLQQRYGSGSMGNKPRGSPPLEERRSSLGSAFPTLAPIQDSDPLASSEAIRQLMKPSSGSGIESSHSTLDPSFASSRSTLVTGHSDSPSNPESYPILPLQPPPMDDLSSHYYDDITNSYSEDDDAFFLNPDLDISEFDPEGEDSFEDESSKGTNPYGASGANKNKDWLLRMNRKLQETPVGELDPAILPLPAIMNVWAKTKSAQGASMVEMWLKRVLKENEAGNERVVPTTKMFTMAGMYSL